MEYFIPNTKGIVLKAEYDGTNYITESLLSVKQDSKFNFGIFFQPTKNLHLKLSYVRGNTLNFGFSYLLSVGKKNPLNITKDKRIKVENSEIIQRVTARSDRNLYRASLLYLGQRDINLQKATISNNEKLEIIYSQSKFRSPVMAVGRTLEILNDISPDKIKSFTLKEVNGGLGMYEVNIDRKSFERYSYLNSPELILNDLTVESFKYDDSSKGFEFNPKIKYPAYFGSFGPELRSQIGGPDGFFFGDLKINHDSEILFKRNLSLISSLSYGVYDNMDELKLPSDSILPHVRTDIVQYLKQSREFSIRRMQLNSYHQLSKSIYLKLSGGILESMFNGYGFEWLYRPFEKNYGIGVEAWKVYQREYNQLFDQRDYSTVTGHTTFYYHHPNSNILFQLKGGRYLAEDSGFTFDASRIFRSGLRIGAFFSLTDISQEEFGEGSFDKGFYFWIPMDIFSNRYFKRNFGWGLRPLTRDGAQSVIHGYPLWGVTDISNQNIFNRHRDDFFD